MDNPQLNESLDKFITEVLANNLYVDVYNHPTGHHAFELFDDNKRTHDIVKKLWISAEQFIIKVHYKITDFTFHYPGETPTTLSPEDLKTIE